MSDTSVQVELTIDIDATYTTAWDWIDLSDLPDHSVRILRILRMFVFEKDPSRRVRITQDEIAKLARRTESSVRRSMKPLYELGVLEQVEVVKRSVEVPGKNRPEIRTAVVYRLNDKPPAGYAGPVNPFAELKRLRGEPVSDRADVRAQSDQQVPDEDQPEQDVSAGGTDRADLPQDGADLHEHDADMHAIRRNSLEGTLPTKETSLVPRDARDQEGAREDVDLLCQRLYERVTANGSKATVSTDWRKSARLLLDRDGRELDKALALIDWATEDEFWSANIQSMPTFRRQYDKLRMRARADWNRNRGQRNGYHSQTDANVEELLNGSLAADFGYGEQTHLLALPGGAA